MTSSYQTRHTDFPRQNLLAALWSNRTDQRPAFVTQIGYRILMIGGALLMFPPAHGYEGGYACGKSVGMALGCALREWLSVLRLPGGRASTWGRASEYRC